MVSLFFFFPFFKFQFLGVFLPIELKVPSFSVFFQERIRVGKELLEAKRIEEENDRKR